MSGDKRIDESEPAALANHRHRMVECGPGLYMCLLCTLELRSLDTAEAQPVAAPPEGSAR